MEGGNNNTKRRVNEQLSKVMSQRDLQKLHQIVEQNQPSVIETIEASGKVIAKATPSGGLMVMNKDSLPVQHFNKVGWKEGSFLAQPTSERYPYNKITHETREPYMHDVSVVEKDLLEAAKTQKATGKRMQNFYNTQPLSDDSPFEKGNFSMDPHPTGAGTQTVAERQQAERYGHYKNLAEQYRTSRANTWSHSQDVEDKQQQIRGASNNSLAPLTSSSEEIFHEPFQRPTVYSNELRNRNNSTLSWGSKFPSDDQQQYSRPRANTTSYDTTNMSAGSSDDTHRPRAKTFGGSTNRTGSHGLY